MPKSKTRKLRFYAERFRKQEPSVYIACYIALLKKKYRMLNGNN